MALIDRYRAHRGRKMQRFPHHMEVYDQYFQRFCGTPVRFLEIGVSGGGSFELWRDYFGPQAQLYGVDVSDRHSDLAGLAVTFQIGDQGDPQTWQTFFQTVPQLDVVIDDGSHLATDQWVTFQAVFPKVQPYGVYCVEDLHTSYAEQFAGGYRVEGTFIEQLKHGLDALHARCVGDGIVPWRHDFAGAFGMHLYPSLAVIEKRPESTYGSATMMGGYDRAG
jgi:hypothetical protein